MSAHRDLTDQIPWAEQFGERVTTEVADVEKAERAISQHDTEGSEVFGAILRMMSGFAHAA